MIPFKIAGMSVGMGLVSEAVGSEGLAAGGEVAGKFIGPAVNISMGGRVIKQLKDLQKDKNKGNLGRGSRGACGETRKRDGSGKGIGNIKKNSLGF